MAATDIDVVVICTPAGGRAEVAIEALEAGKHLIIESQLRSIWARLTRSLPPNRRLVGMLGTPVEVFAYTGNLAHGGMKPRMSRSA